STSAGLTGTSAGATASPSGAGRGATAGPVASPSATTAVSPTTDASGAGGGGMKSRFVTTMTATINTIASRNLALSIDRSPLASPKIPISAPRPGSAPSRHRVVAVPAERMTTQQATQREPAPAPGAVAPDRLLRVRRTRGRIPARRLQPRRHRHPVSLDQHQEESREQRRSTHFTSCASSSANVAPYASRRARTSTSNASPASTSRGNTCTRRISRSRRFSRFRSTALCLYRGTTTPIRGCATGETEVKTSRWLVLLRFPRWNSRRNSRLRVIRYARGNRLRRAPPCGAELTCLSGLLRAGLDDEPLATLLPPTAQHRPPGARRHPRPKPMLVLALPVVRVVRGLSHASYLRRLVRIVRKALQYTHALRDRSTRGPHR